MTDNTQWCKPEGSVATRDWKVCIDENTPTWQHTQLRVASLQPNETREIETGDWEYIIVPLSGSPVVSVSDVDTVEHTAELVGRPDVFSGPTDVAYVPREAHVSVTTLNDSVQFAVCGARACKSPRPKPFCVVGSEQVPIELRGAGMASREVRNFGTPDILDADSIIACEVLTPGGNWSSYPPHKHDEEREGEETALEEIYYFELRQESSSPRNDCNPIGYMRVYGTDERPIDVLTEVRSGDVLLVPHGWHGPAAAAPGYDMYYLNVMAGPGPSRAWMIRDDARHAFIRETWPNQSLDPRLPFGGSV